jgi:hypothetical protein
MALSLCALAVRRQRVSLADADDSRDTNVSDSAASNNSVSHAPAGLHALVPAIVDCLRSRHNAVVEQVRSAMRFDVTIVVRMPGAAVSRIGHRCTTRERLRRCHASIVTVLSEIDRRARDAHCATCVCVVGEAACRGACGDDVASIVHVLLGVDHMRAHIA